MYALLVCCLISAIKCWDLKTFGISDDYYVSDIAVYRTRAFLALPRTVCNNNITSPTVVEVSWPEETTILSFGTRKKLFSEDSQRWGICKDLQSAIALDMEPKKPKLWILDKGNDGCPAKILTYNLFHNSISHSCELRGIPSANLNVFTIDPYIGDYGLKAYVGDAGENTLIVLSLSELKWWKLHLVVRSNPIQTVSTSYFAISKTDSVLYITGRNSLQMFSLDLEGVRNSEGPLAVIAGDTSVETNVTYLGDKLGISSGLESDSKGGLTYYLVRDYAIVRWEIGQTLQAEYHNVLAQSYEFLPYVSQLFTGPQYGVWALVNPFSPGQCQAIDKSEDDAQVFERVVKIIKYNKYV